MDLVYNADLGLPVYVCGPSVFVH